MSILLSGSHSWSFVRILPELAALCLDPIPVEHVPNCALRRRETGGLGEVRSADTTWNFFHWLIS